MWAYLQWLLMELAGPQSKSLSKIGVFKAFSTIYNGWLSIQLQSVGGEPAAAQVIR